MAIDVFCPGCGHTFRCPDVLAGRMEKCPQCSALTRVPAAAGTPPEVEPSVMTLSREVAPANPPAAAATVRSHRRVSKRGGPSAVEAAKAFDAIATSDYTHSRLPPWATAPESMAPAVVLMVLGGVLPVVGYYFRLDVRQIFPVLCGFAAACGLQGVSWALVRACSTTMPRWFHAASWPISLGLAAAVYLALR
jgi:hypothetical protein